MEKKLIFQKLKVNNDNCCCNDGGTEVILCGGLYCSSVQVHGSLAAPELVPTAALLMASPTVNCNSTCLALKEKRYCIYYF